jgi:hypothetical protein
MACLNGIIAGTALTEFRIIHSKASIGQLHNGIDRMLENMPVMFDQVQKLQQSTPSEAAIKEYVKTLYDARLKHVGEVLEVDYTMPLLRAQDASQDGFTVFNRVQERVIRGGIQYLSVRNTRDDAGNIIDSRVCQRKTRKSAGFAGQLEINRLAYDKALEILFISDCFT